MRGRSFGLVASMVLGALAGCGGREVDGAAGAEMVGRAQIALTGVPADGTCIQVVAAGYRTVTRNFDAPAGATSVFEMRGLPLGQVTFTASAFGGACPPAADTPPNWITDAPFTATVAVDPPVLVTLNLVRNGNANVVVGFDDGASAGAGGTSTGGGGAGAAGSAGSAGSTDAGSVFMQVPNATGPSTVTNFEGWFDLEHVDFGAATAGTTAGAGTGAGAGKTTFSVTATLKYQVGVPALYAAAVAGTHEKTVAFATLENGGPLVVWRLTLSNVLISGITSGGGTGGGDIPELTITFVFTSFKIEYDGAQNADGTAGPVTSATFDLQTATGSAPPAILPLQFVVGAPSVMGFETASAFHAPSETTPVSAAGATGGAAAGKPSFTDASVTIPFDATAIGLLEEELAGRITKSATVQIDTSSAAGAPTVFGSYGFQTVQLHGLAITGTSATLSFGASAFSWTDSTAAAP